MTRNTYGILTLVAALVLLATGTANAIWTGAATIRDEAFYVPSSGLTLGAWGTEWGGSEGWVMAEPFQLNLEYQDGVLDKDIANINTYFYPADAAFPPDHTDGTWVTNFDDEEEYVLNIDTNGNLPLYEYGTGELVGATSPDIQWTLTGWQQTILAGDVIEAGGVTTLRVLPAGIYRPFPNDPPVNNVEIFDGLVNCEVLAYTFAGTVSGIGPGSTLGVVRVPEPASCVLLVGAVVGAAMLLRRRQD